MFENVSWDKEYFGLDEVWYNIGAATAIDNATQKISDAKTAVVDTVSSPFRAVYDNFDSITTTAKWIIIAVVGIGIIWLASSLGTITSAASIALDIKRAVGHFV